MTEQNNSSDEITLIIGSYTDLLPHVQARGQESAFFACRRKPVV